MDEDWGALASTRPTFSLFKKLNPEEEAMKNTFVDIVAYNLWSKAERRLYQRLKTQNIVAKIEQEQCNSINDITDCLEQLTFIRNEDKESTDKLDDLINTLQDMKLKASEEERKPAIKGTM